MRVRKAVIPVAGFGTRFLPATRSVPKVMIPVLDRPPIHHSVEEAARAGIDHVVFVLSHGQEAIGQYFSRIPDLEHALEQQGKQSMLEQMREIADLADISLVYQKRQLGLGHAILTARAAVGDEPFAVLLPDDVIWSDTPTIGEMIEIFGQRRAGVIAVREVPDEAIPGLGIIDPIPVADRLFEIARMVEKPALADAPSNLAIVGRYVLTAEVFDALEKVRPGAVGEIQLTDAIAAQLSTQKVYGYRFPGIHFDVGNPLGLLKASVHAALQRDDMSRDLREWLAGLP